MIYNASPGRAIPLGYLGENLVETVVFDRSCWVQEYGPGSFQLVHRRACDTEATPVTIDAAGGVVIWVPTEGDTACRGSGEAQLSFFTPDGRLKKSEVFQTVTLRSLTSSDDPPEPFEGWVDDILEAAAGIENMQAAAETLEPGSSATVTKEVDPETGVVTLTFGIPQGAAGASGVGVTSVEVLPTGEWKITYTDGRTETVGQNVYAAMNILVSAAQTAASQAAGSASGASSSASAAMDWAQGAQQSASEAALSAQQAAQSVAFGGYLDMIVEDEHLIAVITNLDDIDFEVSEERLVVIYG